MKSGTNIFYYFEDVVAWWARYSGKRLYCSAENVQASLQQDLLESST